MAFIIRGEFFRDSPYILARVALPGIGELSVRLFGFLVDTGSRHIVLFLPYDLANDIPNLLSLYDTWEEEALTGIAGQVEARRAGQAILYIDDVDGPIPIPTDELCIRLYDPENPEEKYLSSLPRGILGFQHHTFGSSKLTVDNASQQIQIEYQEPPTPFRLF